MVASHIIFACALVAFGLALAERLARKSRTGAGRWPVYARPILTEAERGFYARLRSAVPQYAVLCQVQIGQFVEVRDAKRRQEVRNRYDRLTADFVLCSEDFRALLVIELDDSSHDRSAQRTRDAKKDAVLAAAGVPVLRFRGTPSVDRIRGEVLKALRGVEEVAGGVEDVSSSGRKLPYIGNL